MNGPISFTGTSTNFYSNSLSPTFIYTSTATPARYGDYLVFVFTATGTITFNAGVTVGTILVGGGGGGGPGSYDASGTGYTNYSAGGGGGSGGNIISSNFSATKSTTYTITVGTGGTGGTPSPSGKYGVNGATIGGSGGSTAITYNGSTTVLTASGGIGGGDGSGNTPYTNSGGSGPGLISGGNGANGTYNSVTNPTLFTVGQISTAGAGYSSITVPFNATSSSYLGFSTITTGYIFNSGAGGGGGGAGNTVAGNARASSGGYSTDGSGGDYLTNSYKGDSANLLYGSGGGGGGGTRTLNSSNGTTGGAGNQGVAILYVYIPSIAASTPIDNSNNINMNPYNTSSNNNNPSVQVVVQDNKLYSSDFVVKTTSPWFSTPPNTNVATEKLRISADGYVGINTSAPGYLLDVSGTVNASTYKGNSFAVYSTYNATDTYNHLYLHVDSNYTYLDSGGSNPFLIRGSTTAVGDIGTQTYGNIIVAQKNTTSANVMIGKDTITSYNLDVSGTVNATSYNASSDYRIKENVVSLNGTYVVDKLRPVEYYNKSLKRQDVGLIAHELQEIYPFLVTGDKDAEHYQSINYTGLIGILIREIQELKKRVAILEGEK
jgi:hypothetical protein